MPDSSGVIHPGASAWNKDSNQTFNLLYSNFMLHYKSTHATVGLHTYNCTSGFGSHAQHADDVLRETIKGIKASDKNAFFVSAGDRKCYIGILNTNKDGSL